MRLRIRNQDIVLMALFILGFLVNTHFYYLGIPYRNYWIVPVGAMGWLYSRYCCASDYHRIHRKMGFVQRYCLVTLFILALLMGYTLLTYPLQGVMGTVVAAAPYFTLLLAYPILIYMLRTGGIHRFLDIFDGLTLVWTLLALLQVKLYPRVILRDYLSTFLQYRGGMLRIRNYYGNFAVVHAFYQLYAGRDRPWKKLYYLAIWGLGMVMALAIQQTRIYTVALALCMLLIVMLDRTDRQSKRTRKVLIAALGLLAVMATGVVEKLIGSFSLTGSAGGGTRARLYAVDYYWNSFLQRFPFGFAFANESHYGAMIHGRGTAYLDDVGVLGQLMRLGVFVIPVYGWLMGRFARVTLRLRRRGRREDYAFMAAVFAYAAITSATLIFLDPQRILLYPVFIALFEYENHASGRETEIQTSRSNPWPDKRTSG